MLNVGASIGQGMGSHLRVVHETNYNNEREHTMTESLTGGVGSDADPTPEIEAPWTSTVEDPTDWAGRGWVGVTPVLAEHAVAELLWADDPDTVWLGGNNPGFDVQNINGRVDAKKAWLEGPDEDRLAFGAPQGGFNHDKVDFIAPVLLGTFKIGFDVLPNNGGRMTATYGPVQIWRIPVDVVNSLIHWRGRGASWVSLDSVSEYKVSPPPTRPCAKPGA